MTNKNKKKIKCEICGKEYVRENHYKKHILTCSKVNKTQIVNIDIENLKNREKLALNGKTLDISNELDLKKITDLAIKDNKLLNFSEYSITEKELKQERFKILNTKDTRIYRKAFLLYVWNPNLMICEMKDLEYVDSIVRIFGTNESYILMNPMASLKGKPVYLVKRGFPISINFQFFKYEIGKDIFNEVLKEIPWKPSEIDAICFSASLKKAFQHNRFDKTIVIYFILSILLSIVSTSLVFISIMSGLATSE